eukprot:2644276-Pleurochrysis_carterae.AAC.1
MPTARHHVRRAEPHARQAFQLARRRGGSMGGVQTDAAVRPRAHAPGQSPASSLWRTGHPGGQ